MWRGERGGEGYLLWSRSLICDAMRKRIKNAEVVFFIILGLWFRLPQDDMIDIFMLSMGPMGMRSHEGSESDPKTPTQFQHKLHCLLALESVLSHEPHRRIYSTCFFHLHILAVLFSGVCLLYVFPSLHMFVLD